MSITVTDNSSLPDLPEEFSCGSSVSTGFVNEYEEILKHAIVAPKFQINEDVYKKFNPPVIEDYDADERKDFSESDNNSSSLKQSYHDELKIVEAKEAFIKKKQVEKKQLRFATSNALDSLLEYSDTPARSTVNVTSFAHQTDSTNSTPEVGQRNSPPSADKDLIRMDSLMDEWCIQLKRNVLAELADMKTRQYQYEENTTNELKLRHNAETLRVTHEVESLKELLYSFEQNVKQKDEVIKNLTDALSKQKCRSDKIRMFSMWRLKHSDEQRQDFASNMAEKFYKRTLAMKVWTGWRSVVESRWKQRVEKACQIKSQEICLKLTEDYEERLQALQKELASARSEVAKMHTERECYEENMKKAFMRGVCALNMEAMSMFHEGNNDEAPSNTHYPCNGPGVPVGSSNETSSSRNNRNVDDHVSERGPIDQTKRHVKFSESTSSESTSQRGTIASKVNNNRKNLNVKMSGKKELGKLKKETSASGHQSSVSSIKVERHVPVDQRTVHSRKLQNSTLPQYAKEQPNDKFSFRKPQNSIPSVKVVD